MSTERANNPRGVSQMPEEIQHLAAVAENASVNPRPSSTPSNVDAPSAIFAEERTSKPPQAARPVSASLARKLRRVCGTHKTSAFFEFRHALDVQDEFWAERVVKVFDREVDARLCRLDFVNEVPRLMFGRLLDKLRFAFRLHDLDADGLLGREDLVHLVLLGLAENGLSSSGRTAELLTDELFSAADKDGDGRISFAEFKFIAKSLPEVTGLIAPEDATGPEIDLNNGVRLSSVLEQARHFVETHVAQVVFLAVWVAINIVLMAMAVLKYQALGASTLVQIARACGAALNFNGGLILVTMTRHLHNWMRQKPLLRPIPVDNAPSFHRILGYSIVGLAVVHTIAHLTHVYPDGVGSLLTDRGAGTTGVALVAVMAVMFLFATDAVRRSKRFELFFYTHLLFLVWFALALAHGPVFWQWAVLPLGGYLADRVLRWRRSAQATDIIEMKALPSGVTRLVMKKPESFKATPGAFIFLRVPAVSRYEWHPFTLSSAPESSVLTVHVRTLGNFTGALYELAATRERSSDTRALRAFIDGPFSTVSDRVFEAEAAVLIGAGIGVTPFASVLESIVLRRGTENSKLQKVYFYWLNTKPVSFEWFSSLLHELERRDVARAVDIRIFMTQGQSSTATLALDLARAAAHAQGEPDLVTGLRAKTRMGRPHWSDELAPLADRHGHDKLGVFYSGPKALGSEVRAICGNLKLRFSHEQF